MPIPTPARLGSFCFFVFAFVKSITSEFAFLAKPSVELGVFYVNAHVLYPILCLVLIWAFGLDAPYGSSLKAYGTWLEKAMGYGLGFMAVAWPGQDQAALHSEPWNMGQEPGTRNIEQ